MPPGLQYSGDERERQEYAGPPPSIPQQDADNCFRILLATDNHIGYAEKDPVRGQDSINTFREILQIARDADVDFILLAGDLFHENRPSRTCMHQTIALLREYTLGDKPIPFELLSDPMDGSAAGFNFPAINYEDPNLNIAIPVFSIHGNHDDPQGTGPEGALCALDVLSVSGVLNYFGKVDLAADEGQAEQADKGIRIKPILLRKGETSLALYGVGNVRDARMHYELRSNKVKMYMPEGGDVGEDDWFNILLVHQNRVKHGPQQSVPEGMFDDSIKLVIWGHEHDCRIAPEKVEGKDYYISQPGSSVATSLAPGEALPKHVGILSIQGSQFQIAEIPLKTVRPFIHDEVTLSQCAQEPLNEIDMEDRDSITRFLRKKVGQLIKEAKRDWKERHEDDEQETEMMLPLIRLKVETTGAKEMSNPVRFGQDFIGKVANPRDILQYYRRKQATERKPKNNADAPEDLEDAWMDGDDAALTTDDRLSKLRMSSLVKQYLKAQELDVLVEGGMENAVMRFVEKDDRDAIKDFVMDSLKSYQKSMKKQEMTEDDVEDHLMRLKENAANVWNEENADFEAERARKAKKGKGKSKGSDVDSMAEEDSIMGSQSDGSADRLSPPARGKKAPASSSRAKAKASKPLFDGASDDEEEEEEEEVMPAKKSRAPPPSKAPAKKAPVRAPAKKTGLAARGKSAAPTQSQLNFSSRGKGAKKSNAIELSDDDD